MIIFRIPFTLCMLIALVGLGVYGATHIGPLDSSIHHDVGYSPRLLMEGQVHRLLTSLFFTAGGWMFYVSLFMFAAIVGWTEWSYRTRRTVVIFWGVHLATLLIVSLIVSLPLAALDSMHGHVLYNLRDVGPSAGYYGCLGYLIGNIRQGRGAWFTSVGVVLVARLIWSGSQLPESGPFYVADLAHVLAISIGGMWGLSRSATDN